jgi:acetyl-CoA acetyltransferase
VSARHGEHDAVISGIGMSEVGRPASGSALALTVDAALAAVADAGLTRADIDGVSTYAGLVKDMPGYSPLGVTDLKEALDLRLNWYSGGPEVPGQLGAVFNAVAAVSAGLARHVLCFRTLTEAQARSPRRGPSTMGTAGGRVDGWWQWQVPFRAYSASNVIAMYAQRHMHEFGTTREQLAQVALTARRHAALNERAIYRAPMTMDDYLSARMISTPLCLFDCDVPVDGSVAVVVSHRDAVPDLRVPPVRVEAIGSALYGRDSWLQRTDLTTMASSDAAEMMWRRTGLRPHEVDVALLYDGFSYLTLAWLEALGFCGHGEGGAFVEGGERIGLTGQLPLNTDGGQLSAGRLHGFGLLHEACVQLRGEGGARQVDGAEVAVVAAGGGPIGGCLLLTC